MIGVPVPGISTIGLGRSSVYGRSREPWPPARTTACTGYACVPVMLRTIWGGAAAPCGVVGCGSQVAWMTPVAKDVSHTGRE